MKSDPQGTKNQVWDTSAYPASLEHLERVCFKNDLCNNSNDDNTTGYCFQDWVPTPEPPTLAPPTPGPPTAVPPTPLPPMQIQSLWYFKLTAKCRKTCWDQKQDWSQKCTWKACGQCSKCVTIVTNVASTVRRGG